jgi:putative transposase
VISYRISRKNDLKVEINTVKEAIKKRDVKGIVLYSD